MAKFCHTDVLDAALNLIKSNASRMIALSGSVSTFGGVAAVSLADVAMASGDFTLANGTVSGRKLTVAAKTVIPVDTAGSATHVALVDDANSKLLYVTTCPTQAVADGGTVGIPAWSIELRAPTA